MNLIRLAVIGAAAMTLGAALPSVASATDYCVYPNENCGADNVKTSEDALAQSAAVDNPDRIFLGADTYTAPTQSGFTYSNATGRLEIIGSGRGRTVVTGPSPGTWSVLYLAGGPGSSVSDLTVRIPANVPLDANGLSLQSTARRIEWSRPAHRWTRTAGWYSGRERCSRTRASRLTMHREPSAQWSSTCTRSRPSRRTCCADRW